MKKEEKLREINSPPRLHVWLVKNNGKLFNVGKFPQFSSISSGGNHSYLVNSELLCSLLSLKVNEKLKVSFSLHNFPSGKFRKSFSTFSRKARWKNN
jgi:hypothetical protein